MTATRELELAQQVADGLLTFKEGLERWEESRKARDRKADAAMFANLIASFK